MCVVELLASSRSRSVQRCITAKRHICKPLIVCWCLSLTLLGRGDLLVVPRRHQPQALPDQLGKRWRLRHELWLRRALYRSKLSTDPVG